MLHLLIQTLAAAVATVGFSLLFGVPARYYPSCAMIGGVGWLAYLLLLPYSSVSIATFAATVIVILLSRWFAVREHCPVTIFLISGIIPLTGFDAVKVAVAIVLGIVFVFEIPQAVFRIGSRGR